MAWGPTARGGAGAPAIMAPPVPHSVPAANAMAIPRTVRSPVVLRASLLLALVPSLASAASVVRAEDEEPAPAKPKETASTTHHEVEINGQSVPYTATAGTYVLETEEQKPKASAFYTSYVREGVEADKRPVTFCFNGGPGSSSVWLHLGLFGPRRVWMGDEAVTPPPPYRLVDNDQSVLDLTDLVFIDPVTTGYSRPAEGEDPQQFHGLDEDVQWVGEFIRLWVTRNARWTSPKYLAGESYGTTRAASLAGHLQDRHGMFLDGVLLVSSILRFQTARFDTGNDLPYALFLPTYTATAWYHGMLEPELQADLKRTLALVEEFALGEYTLALMQGDRLSEEGRRHVVSDLARFTGLSEEYVSQTNLRIEIQRFVKELLREKRLTVGRLDSRFLGRDADAAGEGNEFDPSYSAIQGPYTALLNDYVRRELAYENDLVYEILTGRVHPWKWGDAENQYVDVAETLRSAMTHNPRLRVFVANGYYDLATPYFATDYTFRHMGLEGGARERVQMTFYESGHMMYIHPPSLLQMRADLAAFYGAGAVR